MRTSLLLVLKKKKKISIILCAEKFFFCYSKQQSNVMFSGSLHVSACKFVSPLLCRPGEKKITHSRHKRENKKKKLCLLCFSSSAFQSWCLFSLQYISSRFILYVVVAASAAYTVCTHGSGNPTQTLDDT